MIETMKLFNRIKDFPRFFSEWLGFSFGFVIGLLKNPLMAFIFLETFLFVLVLPDGRYQETAFILQFPALAYVIFGSKAGK